MLLVLLELFLPWSSTVSEPLLAPSLFKIICLRLLVVELHTVSVLPAVGLAALWRALVNAVVQAPL